MSDYNSRYIFEEIWELLSKNPTAEHKKIAQKLYAFSQEYDFSDEDLSCENACVKLGIAHECVSPEYPEDGIITLWPGDEGY